MKTKKVAIDGPAGAGKSSIAKAVSKKTNFLYIDTGAMYRTVGLSVLRCGKNPKVKEDVISVLDDVNIDIKYIDGEQNVFLNGENVSFEIRKPEVSVAASDVAVIGEVRTKLVEIQRNLAENQNVIMDGRDIGTKVLPDADVKIFLTASPEERANRRFKELKEKGIKADYDDILKDIRYRDKNDSEREIDPLRPTDESIILDTTGLDFTTSVGLGLTALGLIDDEDEIATLLASTATSLTSLNVDVDVDTAKAKEDMSTTTAYVESLTDEELLELSNRLDEKEIEIKEAEVDQKVYKK